METNIDNKYTSLYRWNLVMGFLHLIQGFIMFFLSKEFLTKLYWNLPNPPQIPKGFDPSKVPTGEAGRRVIEYAQELAYQVNLGQVIASFLFLSALAHFITISKPVYPWYIKNLKREVNLIRWFEYALSSSVMIFVIAILCNITDAAIILGIVAINACMNLFGAMMEVYNAKLKEHAQATNSNYKTDWSAFVYGCFAGFIPWIIMSIYFFISIIRLQDQEFLPQRIKDVLNTVKFIFPALFVFFNLFAINMYLQYSKLGKWKSYLFGEKAYIILSLVAKSFLAWFIWGGTLRG
jgi:Heliorhodopsin